MLIHSAGRDLATINGHPLILEIVGVAGAGKSTLYKLLRERNPKITKPEPPFKLKYTRYMIYTYLYWYPIYVKKYAKDRWFNWTEIRNMGYLETWQPYLRKQAIEKDLIMILDPGSIYWLTQLKGFGPAITKDERYLAWWEKMKTRWLNSLDIVIWLDAPSDLLFERVLTRGEWHESMSMGKEDVLSSFTRYREGYSQLYNQILQVRKNHIYHFRTDQISSQEIADAVCSSGWILR